MADEKSPVDLWLRRLLNAALILLVCLVSFYVWRIAMITYRIEQTVTAVSGDVKQVTSTAAAISRQVDALLERVSRLEEKSGRIVTMDEVENVLDAAGDIRSARDGGALDPAVAAEVKAVLALIRGAGCAYEAGGKKVSRTTFYLKAYTKYRAYKGSLKSAEDFIARVSRTTVAGRPYRVTLPDGKETAVSEWLTEELAAIRAKK